MCSVRLGQKYYRVGGDSGGDKRSWVLTVVRYISSEILILLRKSVVAGAGFEPATFGL